MRKEKENFCKVPVLWPSETLWQFCHTSLILFVFFGSLHPAVGKLTFWHLHEYTAM